MPALSPEETAALLDAVSAPEPKRPIAAFEPFELVEAFVAGYELRPGSVPAIETCSLYRLYLAWSAKHEPAPRILSPHHFARNLRACGFRPRHHTKAGGRDRREITMTSESAHRMRAWLAAHPDQQSDRDRCGVRRPPPTNTKWIPS